jgi:uncharacterized membrane protein
MMADDQKTGSEEAGEVMSNGGGVGGELLSALKSKEFLLPAAISAVGAVAAAKGPPLMRRLTDATEGKGEEGAERLGESAARGAKEGLSESSGGGMGGIAAKALSKASGGGGGGSGGKKTRRLPIQRWTDVAVPVEQAYEAWTRFDQYPRFMHRVLNVEQKGDDKLQWQEKIWFSKRQWEGRITDRRENDRIVWKTTSGMAHKGLVSFHPVSPNLTRVMVTMEFEPNGMMEKMASGLRFVKRAVQADLARYKAYVEMADAKGIEYRAAPDDDEQDQQEPRKRGSSSEHGNDDEERAAGRQERERRRKERDRESSSQNRSAQNEDEGGDKEEAEKPQDPRMRDDDNESRNGDRNGEEEREQARQERERRRKARESESAKAR